MPRFHAPEYTIKPLVSSTVILCIANENVGRKSTRAGHVLQATKIGPESVDAERQNGRERSNRTRDNEELSVGARPSSPTGLEMKKIWAGWPKR
jgi:hypothetical protein